MIPLVSSLCYGPLEICQLPRLWWKVSLRAAGALADDYPECSGGLDSMVLERLGLERDATLAFVHAERPDYLTFEEWVRARAGAVVDGMRQEWNAFIRGRVHKPGKIEDIYATLGWEADAGVDSAVVLNHLEDWHLWYIRDLGGPELSAWRGRLVPLVSTLDYGPLGVCQLPRTWHKVLLEVAGLLHADYPGLGGGLDQRVIVDVLGLDRDEVHSHLTTMRPTYLDFEAWIRAQLRGRDVSAAVAEWNAFVGDRVHHDEKRADIHGNMERADDGSLPASAVILNHVEDWHYAHRELAAQDGGVRA